MPLMFSRTIASFRCIASVTIAFVALWTMWPVLEVLRPPYFDAILVLILVSSRLKEEIIRTVVLAILTVSERFRSGVSAGRSQL